MRRIAAAITVVVALAFAGTTSVPARASDDTPLYTFVSMPDFLNRDIGDVRGMPGWDYGDPNSINKSYRRAIDVVLDEVEAELPASVFVAGDLVEGHWGRDVENTGIFGPVGTFRQRRRAVIRAGNLYYSEWQERYDERGLEVYPAVGDHEIGDNPWPVDGFKRRVFRTFKNTWARHFTDGRFSQRPVDTPWERTAYAVYLTPEVLLVTVDVFTRVPYNGDPKTQGVIADVREGQLAWLDRLLEDTDAKHVFVQGHTPVIGPVRMTGSSGLMHAGGADSPFWQTLRRHDDRLLNITYLAGEVHNFTAHASIDGGVMQIAHGNPITAGSFNYVVGSVYPDRLEFQVRRITRTSVDKSAKLWATTWKRPWIGLTFARGAATTGTAVINDDGTRTLTGEFLPYIPAIDEVHDLGG